MQQGERTTEYGDVEAGNCKMQMWLHHPLQLLQLSFDLHFGFADSDPASAGDGLMTFDAKIFIQHFIQFQKSELHYRPMNFF
jgi:hypothetical protein